MRITAVRLATCFLLLTPDFAPLVQERTAPFVLSVLRRDGIVLPFAAFDGRRWSRRWPERVPVELPISLDAVPGWWWGVDAPPRRMHLWDAGASVGEVTVTGLTMTRLMCERRLALRSDYKAGTPAPPPMVLPYPKDGLLVSSAVPVGTIAVRQPDSADANKILMLATEEFNKQEKRAAGAFTDWRHPIKADHRKLVPITIEALYSAPADDPEWTAYFVEAIRQFPPGPAEKDGCGLATYVSGWVMVGPNDRARIYLRARVTYCDRKGVGYMLPFGLIQANRKSYWVFQYAGFESEGYEVVRPTARGPETQVVYTAGVCAR
jgi:hypothetical protein